MLLYVPRVMKGDSAKLQRKWQGPYYIVECCNNHTYSLRHAETHVLHKSLAHANRLKPYCEREHSQLCDNDIPLELETEPVGETEEQNGQDNLTVINDTINRPANYSNDNNIGLLPDHSQSGNTQRTIERVMCSRRYRGKLWYRVKWLNKEGRLGGRGYSPQGSAKRLLCKVHYGRQSQEEKAFEADR